MIALSFYLGIGAILFVLGLIGILINRHDLIRFMMCLELMFLAISLTLVAFSSVTPAIEGPIFVLVILALAAAEAALGLAIFLAYFRLQGDISLPGKEPS